MSKVQSSLYKWVLSRPSSKAYKTELSKIGQELKRIDIEKELEKKEECKLGDKPKRISFANGIKSFCIYVPRKIHFINQQIL